MGKGIAAIAAGVGSTIIGTAIVYVLGTVGVGLIFGGCESIIQSRKK